MFSFNKYIPRTYYVLETHVELCQGLNLTFQMEKDRIWIKKQSKEGFLKFKILEYRKFFFLLRLLLDFSIRTVLMKETPSAKIKLSK